MAGETTSLEVRGWLYHPEYPDHWERCTLYSMAQWVNGLAFRDIQFSSTGMPVIKIAEIKGGISGQTKFTQQTFDESVRVRFGDLLFSWSGQPETSIDAFWWRGPDGWLNQHVFRVTPADSIDPTFFFYLLRYLKPNFVGIARNKQTTGLGHVTKRDLLNIEAGYPPLAEQKAIAHILGTLDDKIELNRRMNETLEAMARALFKSWFVDFDPVRVKAEAKASGTSPDEELAKLGVTPDIAALFPDSFQDSELGEIPKGWKVGEIGDTVEVVGGSTPSTKNPAFWDGDIPFATPKDLAGLQFPALLQTGRKITRRGVEKISSGLLPAGTLLLSSRAPIGYLAIAEMPVAMNQGFIAMKCNGSLPALYLLWWLKQNMETVIGNANGTTFLEISKKNFRPIKIVIPSAGILERFTAQVEPLYKHVVSSIRQSEHLAKVRAALLPKLLSGKVRTCEPLSIVEEAVT